MTRAAWFHCFAGISGDMALGSLIDAGADVTRIREHLRSLDVNGWTLEATTTQRNGVGATRAQINVNEDGSSRTYASIARLIGESDLSNRVKKRAHNIFTRLAESEARIHQVPLSEVHFHEVGGVDAIIDITGTCIALELLDVDHVYASSIAVGSGTITAAHGTLPNPAPAVVDLLKGAPTYGLRQQYELTTPTGAAILAGTVEGTESFKPMPAFDPLVASGFGAGMRELNGIPNCTQVIIGELATDKQTSAVDFHGQPVTLLEVNVDDVTGEILAYCVSKLIEVGAHDAWITPIVMKKGRPAYTVSALADIARFERVASTLMAETGSFGVRSQQMERWPSVRHFEKTSGGNAGLKHGPYRTKVEFDEAAEIARIQGKPVRTVIADAEAAAQRSSIQAEAT